MITFKTLWMLSFSSMVTNNVKSSTEALHYCVKKF